jgi:hypothetical protein
MRSLRLCREKKRLAVAVLAKNHFASIVAVNQMTDGAW